MLSGIEEIGEKIRGELDRQDVARERAYTLSRQVVRAASMAIKSIHRREREQAQTRLAECRRLTGEMVGALADTPNLRFGGFVGDAEKELVEAAITIACIEGQAVPGPSELGVDGASWLNGLAEAGGEMRMRPKPSKEGRWCPNCAEKEYIEFHQRRDLENPRSGIVRTNWSCVCGHRWDWGKYNAFKRHY